MEMITDVKLWVKWKELWLGIRQIWVEILAVLGAVAHITLPFRFLIEKSSQLRGE